MYSLQTTQEVQASLDEATKLNQKLKARNVELTSKVKANHEKDEKIEAQRPKAKTAKNCEVNAVRSIRNNNASHIVVPRFPMFNALLKKNPNLRVKSVQMELLTCLKKKHK